MKTIKVYFIFLFISGVIYATLYFTAEGGSSLYSSSSQSSRGMGAVKISEIDISKYPHIPSFNLIEKGEIAPLDKWSDILTGKWEYRFESRNGTQINYIHGVVEYFEDGTFSRDVTTEIFEIAVIEAMKKIHDPTDYTYGTPKIIQKGVMKGKWSVMDSNNWEEFINYNDILVTILEDQNPGVPFGNIFSNYVKDSTVIFGNNIRGVEAFGEKDKRIESRLLEFSEERIVFVGESLWSNFWRMKKL